MGARAGRLGDKLEFMAEDKGITMTIERVPPPAGVGSIEDHSYRITLKHPREDLAALFASEVMESLVRFIGYPRDDLSSVEALRRERNELAAAKADEIERADRAEVGLAQVRRQVVTLVESLADAWWLRAAESYHYLDAWARGGSGGD